MVKNNNYVEKQGKEYRVSRRSSTQGIYFNSNKGETYAKKEGVKMWENKYGKASDIYVTEWK